MRQKTTKFVSNIFSLPTMRIEIEYIIPQFYSHLFSCLVIQSFHCVNKNLTNCLAKKSTPGEPARVLHPNIVISLPVPQSAPTVKAASTVAITCTENSKTRYGKYAIFSLKWVC